MSSRQQETLQAWRHAANKMYQAGGLWQKLGLCLWCSTSATSHALQSAMSKYFAAIRTVRHGSEHKKDCPYFHMHTKIKWRFAIIPERLRSQSHLKSPSGDCLPLNGRLEESNLPFTLWTRTPQQGIEHTRWGRTDYVLEQVSPYKIGVPWFLKSLNSHLKLACFLIFLKIFLKWQAVTVLCNPS